MPLQDRPGGRGRPVGIPYGAVPETCPVRAIERWLAHVRSVLPGYEHGPLFLRWTQAAACAWPACPIWAWRVSFSAGLSARASILPIRVPQPARQAGHVGRSPWRL